jgi:hypothetical protein
MMVVGIFDGGPTITSKLLSFMARRGVGSFVVSSGQAGLKVAGRFRRKRVGALLSEVVLSLTTFTRCYARLAST